MRIKKKTRRVEHTADLDLADEGLCRNVEDRARVSLYRAATCATAPLTVSCNTIVVLRLGQVSRRSDRDFYNIAVAKIVEYLLKGLKLRSCSLDLLEPAVNDAVPVDDSGLSGIKASRDLCEVHFVGLAVLKALLVAVEQARAIWARSVMEYSLGHVCSV